MRWKSWSTRIFLLLVMATSGAIADATPIQYQLSGTTMFSGGPGGLTIDGAFDWGSEGGLTGFAITISGYSSITMTNLDGGTGSVTGPALEFIDYTPDKTQQLILEGSVDSALPTILGESVPFNGTYSYQLLGTTEEDVFTVQGSVTAASYAVPEPGVAWLFCASLPLLLLQRFRWFRKH